MYSKQFISLNKSLSLNRNKVKAVYPYQKLYKTNYLKFKKYILKFQGRHIIKYFILILVAIIFWKSPFYLL